VKPFSVWPRNTIPAASLSPIETNGGAEVAIEAHPYLQSHTEAAYSIADDRPIDIQSLGGIEESFTNVHNHIFQFWPITHIVRTVETNKPVAPSEIFRLQSVSFTIFQITLVTHGKEGSLGVYFG
jgi:hypothetical protein